MREIRYIVIHATATPSSMDIGVDEVRSWHKARGWSDIGYHYLIRRSGALEVGRSEELAGAHVKGYNSKSIGIVYVGGTGANGSAEDNRTDSQDITLANLLVHLHKKYPKAVLRGHRDFPNVKKACPCFDAQKEYGWIFED